MTTDGAAEMIDEELARIAKAVEQRRLALKWSKDEAARQAEISRITWRRIEDGLPVQDAKLAAAEDALGMEPGSLDSVRAGGKPLFRQTAPVAAAVDPSAVAEAVGMLELVRQRWGAAVYEAAVTEVERRTAVAERDRRAAT